MTSRRRSRLAIVAFSIVGLSALLPRAAAAESAHLTWAEELVDNLRPELNAYEASPNYITWPGVNGAVDYVNHTVCTGFVTILFRQAYGWDDAYIMQWMGSTGPTVAKYHHAILTGNGFDPVPTVADIEPGDVIVILYPAGSTASGHVALVEDWPTLRGSSSPVVSGTYQFSVSVADSTKQGHGLGDTRRKLDGTWNPGAGIGTMRLYADADLRVVGYTWSTLASSVFLSQSTHNMAIGRLR
jgi:hypothetical protein